MRIKHLMAALLGALTLTIIVAARATPAPPPTNTSPPPTQTQPPPTPTRPPATNTSAPAATATPAPQPSKTPAPKMAMPLSSAKECGACHASIYEDWQKSYHSQTITAMMAAFAKYIGYVKTTKGSVGTDDLMGCLGCHAPAMRFATDAELQNFATLVVDGQKDAVSNISVDCVACHTLVGSGKPWEKPAGATLTVFGTISDPIEAKMGANVVHKSEFSQTMKTSEMCKTCHTYVTPKDLHVEKGTWDIVCSLTYDSWAASKTGKAAGTECQTCHMKAEAGTAVQIAGVTAPKRNVASHTFPGWHSDAMLAGATTMKIASKKEGNDLVLTVTINSKAGHRMPDT